MDVTVIVLLSVLVAAWVTVAVLIFLRRRHVCPVVPTELVQFDRPDEGGEHRYPCMDQFDGLWETWICRHCGIHHLRKRPGL